MVFLTNRGQPSFVLTSITKYFLMTHLTYIYSNLSHSKNMLSLSYKLDINSVYAHVFLKGRYFPFFLFFRFFQITWRISTFPSYTDFVRTLFWKNNSKIIKTGVRQPLAFRDKSVRQLQGAVSVQRRYSADLGCNQQLFDFLLPFDALFELYCIPALSWWHVIGWLALCI